MKSASISQTRNSFDRAIRVLCPIIEDQIAANACSHCNEYSLRRELVSCILGSQVTHKMATAALDGIEQAGLLDDCWWETKENMFESQVFDVLSGRTLQHNINVRYRFPKARANQISRARNSLAERSLSERLFKSFDAKKMRQSLVTEISGVGPKQASMFLRNTGKSYDLAILDTHVLRFMDMQNLLSINQRNISTVTAYERTERVFVDYADRLGYPVGYLDWAIWATMRAARELGI